MCTTQQPVTCQVGIWHDCPNVATTSALVAMLKGKPLELPSCQDCADDLRK